MKNFLEAQAIKPDLKLNVSLILKPVIGTVPCLVKINNETYYEDKLATETIIAVQLALTDPIDVSIQIYRNHPDAIQVELFVDGHEVMPKYQHLATPPTDYLNQTGVWSIQIPNFYPWYHDITGQGWIA